MYQLWMPADCRSWSRALRAQNLLRCSNLLAGSCKSSISLLTITHPGAQDAEVAESNIKQLELELATEHKRRLSEQLRAIIEGGSPVPHSFSRQVHNSIAINC